MDSSGPSPSWKDPPSCQGRLVCWPQQVLSQPGTLVPGPGAQSLTLATSSLTSLHPKPSSCPQLLTGIPVCSWPPHTKSWRGKAEM